MTFLELAPVLLCITWPGAAGYSFFLTHLRQEIKFRPRTRDSGWCLGCGRITGYPETGTRIPEPSGSGNDLPRIQLPTNQPFGGSSLTGFLEGHRGSMREVEASPHSANDRDTQNSWLPSRIVA